MLLLAAVLRYETGILDKQISKKYVLAVKKFANLMDWFFFSAETLQDLWIGMNDLKRANYYQWSDGSEVTYTNWNFNEPNGNGERCVQMYKTTWVRHRTI